MTNTRPKIVTITARDGTELAAAVYMPQGAGPFPALFAASPYRFDNNILAASPQFLWRETGPIDWYMTQGYAYVHLDVRGSGRSGGHFGFLDRKEQEDLYDAIEWVGAQPWSNGRVGGIGQSYYCMLQWFMGAQNPPALKCLGAHDGLADPYRANCYNGGIPGDFFPGYWWYQNRFINRFPAEGPAREQETDLTAMMAAHPLYDDFWKERCAREVQDQIKVPIYCSGVWSKMFIHVRGVIDGYRNAQGPKKMRMSGAPNAWGAAAEFANVEFHEKVLLPFYDHYLKGLKTEYEDRPPVQYAVRGSQIMRSAQTWPPENVRYERWLLNANPSASVTSLNDGGLAKESPAGEAATSYDYPNPGWVAGVVGFGPQGPASGFDPVRRVLTFTSAPLASDLEIAGPIKMELFASSSATNTDFFIKVSDQFPQAGEDRAKGVNPFAEVVSRGWLRASHRAIDPARSTEMEPYHPHDREEPINPGQIYKFEISIEPMAYLFKQGHRIRLEIVNGDSPVSEQLWPHFYRPDKTGRDTIHHSVEHPSSLILPVSGG